jgi:TolB protein
LGSITSEPGDKIKVTFVLADLVKGNKPQALLEQTYEVLLSQQRALAHHISDLIFKTLTGVPGIFSTRIAYVQRSNTNPASYSLVIADADGFNPRSILTSGEPIMSPAWSPNSKQIAYVSFEGQRSQIYVATIASGARYIASVASGINGAPAWSPNGQELALVLSKSGTPKIYLLNLATRQLRQLTTGSSIDTEPSFSPDGKWIIFTSDRSGNPQIYRYWLNSGKIDRLTFSGDYNARGSVSPDGKQIVMIDRSNGKYDIAVQDLAEGHMRILTDSGRNDSPTWAPNGKMILYANEYGELGLVSIDARVRLRVPGKGGRVKHPAWSPIAN